MDVSIDIRKNAILNAQEHYERAKKAAVKVTGAQKALAETISKIEKLKTTHAVEKAKTVRKKEFKEKRWFDKFRWFESSDGFLVVGGRDAVTNEILIKKHAEKNDFVFHADVHGAPFFLVKNPSGGSIPENTMREAADAAAAYSSAWKAGLGSCDVYYVKPDQVSKKAESGEFLPKGGFMIRGTKAWFRSRELVLALGLVIGDAAIAIGGPVSAVAAKTEHYSKIGVGSLKPGELALEVKKQILRTTIREDGVKVKDISLEELQRFIPSGTGRILA